jgi:hypothetical protein
VISAGAPLGMALMHPLLGEVMAIIELVVIVTVLFGNQVLSERAFRLLRWLRNQPEPPAPTSRRTARSGGPPDAAKDDHRRAAA